MVVRPMELDEVDIRIDYFHDASDEYLAQLGADRARLPSRDAWRTYYAEDFARPLAERETYNLIWEVDGRPIGFSSVDHIDFGEEAFMHLHIVEEPTRRRGLGTELVRLSVAEYFRALELQPALLPAERLQRRAEPGPAAGGLPLRLHQGDAAEHAQLPAADHPLGARARRRSRGRPDRRRLETWKAPLSR